MIDIASRRVAGSRWLITCAPNRWRTRWPTPSPPATPSPGVIFHSDRGCQQHTSAAFADLAGDCQVSLSVGRKGQCWDIAVAESFFASLKGELADTRAWPTRAGACRAVVEYIGWYNGTRLHSTLGYRSPATSKKTRRKAQECSRTELSALSVKAGQPQRSLDRLTRLLSGSGI